MTAWNTKYPEWCYDNLSNFKRDCQNAIAKLLAPVPLKTPFFLHSEEHDAKTPRKS